MINPRINIFPLPASNRNNKYIDLFASSLRENHKNIHVYALPKDDPLRIASYFRSGDLKNAMNVIHIHWPTVLYGSKYVVKSLILLAKNVFVLYILKHIFGVKIAWTVHNFFAHDYPHPKIDKWGQDMVRKLADLIIVQQHETLGEYKAKYPTKNIHLISHPNYINVYGPLSPVDNELRQNLGFKEDDIVLLSLGAIAPYKKNEKIIDVLRKMEGRHRIKLLICGKGNHAYVEKLQKYAQNVPSVVIQNGFIPDEYLSQCFSLADYSIFYYDESEMTSGGIPLSLSYGVPVITRSIPASEIISDRNGFIFEHDEDLFAILREVNTRKNKNGDDEHRHDIIASVKEYGWDTAAAKLLDLYKTLWAHR